MSGVSPVPDGRFGLTSNAAPDRAATHDAIWPVVEKIGPLYCYAVGASAKASLCAPLIRVEGRGRFFRSRIMRSPRRLARFVPLALGALVCSASASLAETQDEVVAQMKAEGYNSIDVSTTWLRRVRIVGEGAPGSREVVIDPRNGEVLRDFSSSTPPDWNAPAPVPEGVPGSPRREPPGGPGGRDHPGGPGGHDHPGGPGGHDHPGGPGDPGGPGGGRGGPDAGRN